MMDYNASITYRNPVTANAGAPSRPAREGRILGLRCPVCGRTYPGGKGYCPVDASSSPPSTKSTCRRPGTVTNYTVVTPVQYPGQTETEPFARVHVLLDGTDVMLGYQPMVDTADDDVRIGMRVEAVWAPDSREGRSPCGSAEGSIVGWMPTGEPDVDDPDLVNRIY